MVKKMLEKSNDKLNIWQLVSKAGYQRAPVYIVKECKRVYNEISNCYYTYRQIVLYMTYSYLIDGKVPSINNIRHKNIKEVMRLFSTKQHRLDKKFVKEILEKTQLTDRGEIIKALIPLTKEKYISPMFFLDVMRRKLLTERDEHDIFIDEDLKKFLFTMKQLNNTFTEVCDEQKKVCN